MPEWLKELLTCLGPFAGFFFGWLSTRNAKALAILDATIKRLDATIKHLEFLLADSREKEAKAAAENESTQKQYNAHQKMAAIYHDTLSGKDLEIRDLQDKISGRPCLVRRGLVYVHAFPEEGEESFCYCAECLEKDRVITRLEPNPEVPCSNGKCPKHRRTFG